ncbi:MAG: hypothetical protein M1817_004559 [Caeruleum heppii]|nr:MAG: hypothetical protein M1817_004559 [Caeruleum heppii]
MHHSRPTDVRPDFHLHTRQNVDASPLPPGTKFDIVAAVDPAQIPLYLTCGPTLDVRTDDKHTQRWLEDIFSTKGKCTYRAADLTRLSGLSECRQSDVGVLLKAIDAPTTDNGRPGPRVTEILLYASIQTPKCNIAPATPPASSSPSPEESDPEAVEPESVTFIDVHALPLSSDLLYNPSKVMTFTQGLCLNNTWASDVDGEGRPQETQFPADDNSGQFLPSMLSPPHQDPCSHSAVKRKRVEGLFETAVQQRKKAKRRGGDNVLMTMSSQHRIPMQSVPTDAELPRTSQDLTSFSHQLDAEVETRDARVGLNRSASVSSAMQVGRKWGERPSSRKSMIDNSYVSNLPRAGSIATNTQQHIAACTDIETTNKEALSRIIMAGMRLYGLQQRRRNTKQGQSAERAGSISTAVTRIDAPPEEVDEYKIIYHQTLKGACLALRRQISTVILKPDQIRDVVDRLLAIFCVDPLESAGPDLCLNKSEADDSPFFSRRSQMVATSDEMIETQSIRRKEFADDALQRKSWDSTKNNLSQEDRISVDVR